MKQKSKTGLSKLKHDELPASVGLVKEVRNELLAEIRSVDHKLSSVDHRFNSVDHRLNSVDHRLNSVDHRLNSLDHKIDSVDKKVDSLAEKVTSLDHKINTVDQKVDLLEHKMMAKFEESLAVAHRTQVLMEEQRNENRIVLDGLKMVIERQDRMELQLAKSPL